MKIARTLGATAVLFASLTLFGSPQAFACSPEVSCSGSSSGSSSSGDSSSGSSSSGDSSSGESSSGDESSSSSGSSSSGHSSGDSNSCDAACQRKKDEKKKKGSKPSTVVVIPPAPRTPVRRYAPVAPPTEVVPEAPAETPILEQDAVSRQSGELIVNAAAVSGASTTGVDPAAQTSETNGGDTGDAELTATASPTATSGDTSPPWGLIGGGVAVGLLGAGLAFAPSRRPPLPPPPPMDPTNHYPGY